MKVLLKVIKAIVAAFSYHEEKKIGKIDFKTGKVIW